MAIRPRAEKELIRDFAARLIEASKRAPGTKIDEAAIGRYIMEYRRQNRRR